MKVLYLDLISGISGDMFLGAMLDLGVDFAQLEKSIAALGLTGIHWHLTRQQRCGIAGVKVDVHENHEHHEHAHADPTHHDHGHHHGEGEHDHGHESATGKSSHPEEHSHDHDHGRSFGEIRDLIQKSRLSTWCKEKAVAVFEHIARAEGKIHGKSIDDVHFHEVGAVDSIVDIVGACAALELLGKPTVKASTVTDGSGWVECAHGRFPIPAPATLEILGARGIPISQSSEPHELVTPTGAALLAEFVESFGPMENLRAEKIGYGLGTRELASRPNVLRAILGEQGTAVAAAWETDEVDMLETNLDDVSGEVLGHVFERLMAAGALDVFYQPVMMKKQRPGILLTVVSPGSQSAELTELILRETGSFGLRRRSTERRKLRREIRQIVTPFGTVQVKVGFLGAERIHRTPEFEACRAIAEKKRMPLKAVYDAVYRTMDVEA